MRVLLVTALVLGAACKPGKGSEAPGITVAVPYLSYGDNANAPPDMMTECRFEKMLPDAMKDYVNVQDSSGNTLKMEIVRVGGGIVEWEGEHFVIVEGEYIKDGVTAGTFRIKRGAYGSAMGGTMRAVCKGFEDVAYIMAEDISTWMEKPENHSKL